MWLCVADKVENKDLSSPAALPMKEEPIHKPEQPKNEETALSKLFYDVVNVSEGFQLRTAYKKKVKPSKLDGLLERRVKQFTFEEKQRLEKMRQSALLSKTAPTKANSGVKTEGSALGKQPAVTPCVKEEKEGNLHVKDHVVKKLDFEQEQKEADSAATNHSKEMDAGEVTGHREVNGGPLANTELNNTNCLSETLETKEKMQTPEVANAKKRGYEEMEQGSEQIDAGSDETDQTKTSAVQVNGQTPAEPNVNSEPDARVQLDAKEPLKSLMNGNLSQNEVSDMCRPPPLKVPKIENHVTEKGASGEKPEGSGVDGEEATPENLPNSSPTSLNSINTDDLKPSITPTTVTSSSIKTDVVSSAPSNPSATQPSSGSQKAKTGTCGSTTTTSMGISKDYSTRERVSLLRFSKSRKARSGTALPSYRKFVTKSSKKSIFVLPSDDLKRLARRAGIREVPIFNYNAKPAQDIWPYPSPRPTFSITWRLVADFISRLIFFIFGLAACNKHLL